MELVNISVETKIWRDRPVMIITLPTYRAHLSIYLYNVVWFHLI